MIRNVVIHITNEQPLLADLYETPNAIDQGLLCTNIRTMDGKKPIFIDHSESTFFFPYLHIRFLEIMATSTGVPELQAGADQPAEPTAEPSEPESDADLELDEDFLRRIREV